MPGLKSNNNAFHILKSSNCVEVAIRKNGGYYDNDENITLIHGLVFCENSKCLEVMPMSYNKNRDMYYVDNQVYNNFRMIYGLPIVTHVLHSERGWQELREESLLHSLGYNVNATDGLSDAVRHRMLARFVDLGFIDVHSVVKLLTHLIILNRKTRDNACRKWENDLTFIRSYRVDPDRFAFVSKIRRL
jgi:hypothetical protein